MSATTATCRNASPQPIGRHPAGEIEDPADHEGADEAARVAGHRVQGQGGAAPARVGAAGGARRERGRIEPDEQAVDEHQRGGERVGARAEKADDRAADDARGHGQAHEPLAAEADRHLVAGHARPRADEPHGRGHDRGRDPRASLAGGAGHVGEEGDRPAAQRVHLPRVGAVGDGVGHGGAIAERRAGSRRARRPAGRRRGASGRARHRNTISQAIAAAPAAARRTRRATRATGRARPRTRTRAPRRCRCRRRGRRRRAT